MATTKNAIVQALVDGILTELMVKTQTDNVWLDDTTTLSAKLSEMITAINLRAKSEDVTTEIEAAINALIADAPETYDTLKEISDYINEHQEVVDALNAAIGNKADQSALEALETTANTANTNATTALTTATAAQSTADSALDAVNALGALASKDAVSESDLDSELQEKVNAASEGNHSHSNKEVLDGITSDLITEWNSKGTVFVSADQPSDLAAGDLWFNISE